MKKHKSYSRIFSSIIIVACVLVLVLWKQLRNWGATDHDLECKLPADWMIGDKYRATYAIKVSQPPGIVFNWLSQLGRGAGYYCDPRLFNRGRQSATYLLDDLPLPQISDKNERLGTLVDICDNYSLTWLLEKVTPCGMSFQIRRTFLVQGYGLDHSRIIARTTIDWEKVAGWLMLLPLAFKDAIDSRDRLQSLKSAIESYGDAEKAQTSNRHMAGRHQADLPYFARNPISND